MRARGDREGGEPHLPGLIDPDEHDYDPNRTGPGVDRSGASRAEAAPNTIPAGLAPSYEAAAATYRVHWLLLAAIHQRETDFSTLDAPGVRSGWNGCGAAGPMQFGIVGVPPYRATAPDCGALTGTGADNTWARYRDARDKVDFPVPAALLLTVVARFATTPASLGRRLVAGRGPQTTFATVRDALRAVWGEVRSRRWASGLTAQAHLRRPAASGFGPRKRPRAVHLVDRRCARWRLHSQ